MNKLKGFIGNLSVTIPWNNLRNEAIIVTLTDVFLILEKITDLNVLFTNLKIIIFFYRYLKNKKF